MSFWGWIWWWLLLCLELLCSQMSLWIQRHWLSWALASLLESLTFRDRRQSPSFSELTSLALKKPCFCKKKFEISRIAFGISLNVFLNRLWNEKKARTHCPHWSERYRGRWLVSVESLGFLSSMTCSWGFWSWLGWRWKKERISQNWRINGLGSLLNKRG